MKKRILVIPALLLAAVAIFLLYNRTHTKPAAAAESYVSVLSAGDYYLPEELAEEYESFSVTETVTTPLQFGDSVKSLLTKSAHSVEEYTKQGSTAYSPASEYFLYVNYKHNVVTVCVRSSPREFLTPVRAMVCSTGTSTPHSGIFKPIARAEWGILFGGVFGQYTTTIVGDILFHSVPYTEMGNPASLEWEEFDKLGEAASLGCIRLQVTDAKWIYDNADKIRGVQFVGSDVLPLGKPEAMKISGYEDLRDWDPTDTNPENPWLYADISE